MPVHVRVYGEHPPWFLEQAAAAFQEEAAATASDQPVVEVTAGRYTKGENGEEADRPESWVVGQQDLLVCFVDALSEQAAERFIASGGLKPSTCDYYEMRLERVTSEAPLLADVTLDWIKDYVSRRLGEVTR